MGTIETQEASLALDFFLAEIGENIQKKKIILKPIMRDNLISSRKLIFEQNLYAADALHANHAIVSGVLGFVTFDVDFKVNLNSIPILNPIDTSYKSSISSLKDKYLD
ncbi:MAG: hypothetical protein ACXAD7_09120 [Candidatus Kariarchaeaceae archaeon]